MKKLIALLLALCMLVSFAACGPSTEPDNDSKTPSEATTENQDSPDENKEEVVLSIPSYMVGENVGAVYFEPAVERFNEKYAGTYKIVLEEITEADYYDQITRMAQTGDLPLIVCGAPSTAKDFIDTVLIPQALYYPMNGWLEEHPEIAELCLPASLDYCTQENGDIVTVPIVHVSTVGLFYNSDLYTPSKSIGSMTPDEFLADLGEGKFAFQTVDNAWTSMLYLSALIANEEGGAELLAEYDGKTLYDYEQPCIINAVAKFQKLWATNAAANSLGAAYADAANAFMSNNASVIANGPWMNGDFAEASSDNWSNGFTGSAVRGDVYPGNIALANTASYGRWIVTNNYKSEEELQCALAFMAHLYSQEELEKYMLAEGGQCPNMNYTEEYLTALSADTLLSEQSAAVTPETKILPNVATIMPGSVAEQVFAADLVQLVNGAMTPEEFCHDLTVKAEETKN